VPITVQAVEGLLEALDEALLLENERFQQARDTALQEYLRAPFREPTNAGQSYPADVAELRDMLQRHFEAAETTPDSGHGRGLVSPHIDYARGGPVYAQVWKRAAQWARDADVAVVLGTDHYGGDGQLTPTRQSYATPFGVLPTATDVVDALARSLGVGDAFSDELHHRGEHSIELAAVWLHFVRQERPCALVPVLCGSFGRFVRGEADPATDARLARFVDALSEATAGRRTLFVAAADLAHVGPAFGGPPQGLLERGRLQAADDELTERVCAGDAAGFFAAIQREGDRFNVCGVPPIYLLLRLLQRAVGEKVGYLRCPADEQGTSLVSICGVTLK
jgi:AmmeMemoRadiSam system protein B